MSIELTPQERNSTLALRLTEHLTEELAKHRAANDWPLSPEKTAELRGKIVGVKNMPDLLAGPKED